MPGDCEHFGLNRRDLLEPHVVDLIRRPISAGHLANGKAIAIRTIGKRPNAGFGASAWRILALHELGESW